MSARTTLRNDMMLCEKNSDRYISKDNFYVISIKFDGTSQGQRDPQDQKAINLETLASFVKRLLRNGDAIIAYTYDNEVYYIFSSIEEGVHEFGGSHHAICSNYASKFALECNMEAKVSIIEFETKMTLLIYFQTKVFNNLKQSAYELSDGKLNKKELDQLTLDEIEKLMIGIDAWGKASKSTKYGTFYKHTVGTDGKEKFSTLSERINVQDQKYLSYFFN